MTLTLTLTLYFACTLAFFAWQRNSRAPYLPFAGWRASPALWAMQEPIPDLYKYLDYKSLYPDKTENQTIQYG